MAKKKEEEETAKDRENLLRGFNAMDHALGEHEREQARKKRLRKLSKPKGETPPPSSAVQ